MRNVTYVEFEAGDPEPAVPYVLDGDGDKWVKSGSGDKWCWGSLRRTWAELLESSGTLHAPEDLFEAARAEIERQIAELEAKADQLRASLGIRKARVWTDGVLPVENGLKVLDREGDMLALGVNGVVRNGHWRLPDDYAPYTEVLDPISAKPRVWSTGTLPIEDGLKVRDREGDMLALGVNGEVRDGHWCLSDYYSPYTEVLDTP